MSHPFYGDYKKANYQVNKSLDNYITQAARLMSNERMVRHQQKEAKNRLKMELDSVEQRHNRTETRLDTMLRDNMLSSEQNRRHAEDLHPGAVESQQLRIKALELNNQYNRDTMDYRVGTEKFQHNKLERDELEHLADKTAQSFIADQTSGFEAALDKGFLNTDGTINKEFDTLLDPYDDFQLKEQYDKLVAANPNIDDSYTYKQFKEDWADNEADYQAMLNQRVGRDLLNFEQNHNLTAGKGVEKLFDLYGKEDWFKRMQANQIINNPNATDLGWAGDGFSDGYDFTHSGTGQRLASDLQAAAVVLGKGSSLNADIGQIYDVFNETKDVKRGVEAFRDALASTDEGDLDDIEFGARIDKDGNKLFTFTESDTGPDDKWVGRLTDDGQIIWQTDRGGRWTEWGNFHTTEEMLDSTEGLGGGDWTFRSSKYKFKK